MLKPNCPQFREADAAFRLIEDDWRRSVVLRYPAAMAGFDKNAAILSELAGAEKLSRELARRLRRFTVSVSRVDFERLRKAEKLDCFFGESDAADESGEGVWVLRDAADCGEETGLGGLLFAESATIEK